MRLSKEACEQLRNLVGAGKNSARVQTRARLLLRAAERRIGRRGGRTRRSNSNRTIGEDLLVSVRTVSRVRQRFVAGGLKAALGEQERSGRATEIDGEAAAQLVMLACSQPSAGGSRWRLQRLADRRVALGSTEHLSDTWVLKLLKKTNCDRGQSRVGVFRKCVLALWLSWKTCWLCTQDRMSRTIQGCVWMRKARNYSRNEQQGCGLSRVREGSARSMSISGKAAPISCCSVNR